MLLLVGPVLFVFQHRLTPWPSPLSIWNDWRCCHKAPRSNLLLALYVNFAGAKHRSELRLLAHALTVETRFSPHMYARHASSSETLGEPLRHEVHQHKPWLNVEPVQCPVTENGQKILI